ncbi:MAG: hypothetical protein H6607_00580 [Flavobacteriales bacterium]|nr:hypothetical protein [Flavobacteriales bacterium]
MKSGITYIGFRFSVALTFLIFFGKGFAKNSIVFNQKCLNAQQEIYAFKLTSANTTLNIEEQINPSNAAAAYLKTMVSVLKYLATESSGDFSMMESNKKKALDLLADCDELSGYRDFLKAEIYFYSSVANGKKGNSLSAGNDIRHAYNFANDVLKKYPNFVAANKTKGIISSGLGSLPETYRKLVNVLGYSGGMDEGISLINKFRNAPSLKPEFKLMQEEANFYLASIYLYLKNDATKCWEIVDSYTKNFANNPLKAFARIHFAEKCKKNEEVIRIAEQFPKGSDFQKISYIHFVHGKAKLQRLDKDADVVLKTFIKENTGKNYIKSCYQKLAWHALINGKTDQYNEYILKLSGNGNTNLEEDEQAQKEAESSVKPNAVLLKSRLLFDGGYYQKALEGLNGYKSENFATIELKTEYAYRKARIYDALHYDPPAIEYYKATIQAGEKLSNYYASYACIYLAEIYERQKNKNEAIAYYKKATTFSANKEYKKSIELKAKNGLERLK